VGKTGIPLKICCPRGRGSSSLPARTKRYQRVAALTGFSVPAAKCGVGFYLSLHGPETEVRRRTSRPDLFWEWLISARTWCSPRPHRCARCKGGSRRTWPHVSAGSAATLRDNCPSCAAIRSDRDMRPPEWKIIELSDRLYRRFGPELWRGSPSISGCEVGAGSGRGQSHRSAAAREGGRSFVC